MSSETTTATVPSTAPIDDESNVNLEDYAAEAELPACAAPIEASLTFPLVQYAKGVLVVSGRKPQKYTGFQIETEQSTELDALFEAQGLTPVRVRHQNKKEGNYWQLPSIAGYILCKAIPDGYGPDVWKTGIPYVWNNHKDTYMFGSQLQCIFFSSGLIKLGYTQPLVLTFSRTVTEHFVSKVLRRQEWMINAVKKALKRQNKPADHLAFYSYGMELVKGEEVMTKDGGSYFAPAIAMPSPLTVAYVKRQQTPASHLAIIEEFLPALPQWAEAASFRLMQPPRENGAVQAAASEPEPEEAEEA